MDNSYLHYRYIILMLALALVCTFAYCNCGDDELVKIISFAGTLISIVLSLLAIFITVLSNDSMSGMIHKIRDLYDVIKDMPTSIDKSISSLSESTEQLQINMQKFNDLLPELRDEINHVDQHIKESSEAIKALSSQQIVESKKTVEDSNRTIKFDEYFKNFLQGSSFVGICLIYLIYVAAKAEKSVSLAEYCKKIDVDSTLQYDFGFYIACRAAGMFTCNLSSDESFLLSNIRFTDKLSKEDIIETLRICSASLANPSFSADDYISKIDKFVNGNDLK